MSPLTDQQLDEYAALADAATPGPWHLTDSDAIVAPLTQQHVADVWEPTAASRNGEFIEAARTAVPALLAEVRRLRQQDAPTGQPEGKPRLLDCGLCFEEHGEEIHPHPACTVDRLAELEAEHRRWAAVHALVERAIDKGVSVIDTLDLSYALGPDAPVSA